MQGLRISIAALLAVALLGGCRSAPPAATPSERAQEPGGLLQRPAGDQPEPAGRRPQPGGQMPGQGCHQVVLEPPCTLASFTPTRVGEPVVSYIVHYRDAKGREVQPYYLEVRREETTALEAFFRDEKNRVVECQGGWTSPPCNDSPHLTGFPAPPVGKVTPRGR